MNKWQKIGLAVGMGTAVITTTHLINSIIFKLSTANNYTGKRIRSNYQWKFGNIAYITAGSGSPLLLIQHLCIHSLSMISCSMLFVPKLMLLLQQAQHQL